MQGLIEEAREVSWRTDDWEAFSAVEPVEARDGLDADQAIASILRRLPEREAKTAALVGRAERGAQLMLEAEFGHVVTIDNPDAELSGLRRRLDAVLIPEPMPALAVAGSDALLVRLHGCLVEGGLLVAAFTAMARGSRSVPMVPALPRTGDCDEGLHELQLQFRLLRCGFQGVRTCRVPADPVGGEKRGETIVCAAIRRASN